MKYGLSFIATIVLALVCTSCNQDETVALITTGSEAAFSAGLVVAKNQLSPTAYTQLVAGLTQVDTGMIAILNSASSTTTLQDVFNLAMITDPQLAQYQDIVNFALPVLADIPDVQKALTSTIANLSSNAKADAIAFFQGSLNACQNAPKGISKDLQKIAKDRGLTFDTDALATNLKAHAPAAPAPAVPAPVAAPAAKLLRNK